MDRNRHRSAITGASLVVLGLVLAACGNTAVDNSCRHDFTGTYRVISESRDPNGCGPGAPVTDRPIDSVSISPSDLVGSQDVSACSDLDSCGFTLVPDIDLAGGGDDCIGVSTKVATLRQTTPVCITVIDRLTVSGTDPLTIVQETFEASEQADANGQCPSHPDWSRGENLPACQSATRIVAERVQ